MCDVFIKTFMDCMKNPIKKDKCKTEFEHWYECDTNTYLQEFIVKPNPIQYVPEKDRQPPST